jgi:hypothetical protein
MEGALGCCISHQLSSSDGSMRGEEARRTGNGQAHSRANNDFLANMARRHIGHPWSSASRAGWARARTHPSRRRPLAISPLACPVSFFSPADSARAALAGCSPSARPLTDPSCAFAVMALAVTYLPLFMPPTPNTRGASGTGAPPPAPA